MVAVNKTQVGMDAVNISQRLVWMLSNITQVGMDAVKYNPEVGMDAVNIS